jgi:MoxR-like ATPase
MSIADLIPDLENHTRKPPASAVALPASRRAGTDHPENYLPDLGLIAAMRVSVLLRRPLLLTGEPGAGKTQAGNYLNWKLGYGLTALRFDSKSTSVARDLFYTYDTIGRFHAAQAQIGSQNPLDYLRFNALGLAILRANDRSTVEQWLPRELVHAGKPMQSVVLIDEIDKAPRDFPNDLLNEIENNVFRVPELGNISFSAAEGSEPALVITSNSEKNLPGPFLRRCVYFHLPKPDKERFGAIVKARLAADPASPLIGDALDFLMYLRSNQTDLRKAPSTAELLDFLLYLQEHKLGAGERLRNHEAILTESLSTLVKDDAKDGPELVRAWIRSK